MKKTLQDQYLLIKEGKGHKDVFIKEAKRQFPGLIRNSATYTEVANVLKTKNLINENVIGLKPINQLQPSKKESYEIAFENFIVEAKKKKIEDEKAELKKPSKQVEEDAEKNFDYEDKKNPDNLIFDQMMKGYYTEMKDPKNEDKTMEQLKAIVIKNLEKNPIYYTEKGQFGVKDLGYTMDAPGLGEPKEPKGKYKSSGYGNLNENKLLKEALNKDLKDFGSDVKKFLESKGLKVKLGQGEARRALYDPIEKNDELAALQLQNPDLHIIVNDSKIDVLEDIIKRYNLKTLQSLRQTGGWDDDPKKKAQAKGEIYLTKELERGRKGKAFELVISRFDPSSIFVPSNNKESINEEDQIRKVVRSIINEELEEGYDDVFEDKKDDGFDEVWEKFKKDLRKRMGQPESPKNESLNESKIRKVIKESVEKELQEINKLAEYEVFESKLEKIAELIEKKSARLNRIDEDEDLKALTDKKKVKELQKDIKKLEKAKAKIERALAKKAKSTPKKKEVIDEDEPISEVASEDAEATSTAAGEAADELERAADAAKELDDALEEDIEAPADYLAAKEDAELRYEAGEELNSILSDYPKHRNTLERDILGKFDGMDY